MSQAEDFCRQLQIRGRADLPALARQFRARRSRKRLAYTFTDGSEARLSGREIVEAVTVVTAKYWISPA